ALDGLRHVEADVVHRDPICLAVAHQIHDLGVPQQRLAWDTAPVEAKPATALLLDQHNLLAELSRANRGHVPARTAADNGDVALTHGRSAPARSRPSPPWLAAPTASPRDTTSARAGPPRRG